VVELDPQIKYSHPLIQHVMGAELSKIEDPEMEGLCADMAMKAQCRDVRLIVSFHRYRT